MSMPDCRQPLQAGEAQQREALGQLALDLERQQLVAGKQLRHFRDHRRQRLQGRRRDREQIGVPAGALVGLAVDQHQRRPGDRPGGGLERQVHRHDHGPRIEALDADGLGHGHWLRMINAG
ncbi:hypothetical protein ACVJGC_005242 [Bradyrhizobium diazoefficiens]